MPDIRTIIEQATLASSDGLPWPELTKIDFSHNVWRFYYSDGHVEMTRDSAQAERISRMFFLDEKKTNSR